jgi:hypothetical protein
LQTRNIVIESVPGTGQIIFEGINNGHTDISHGQFFRQGSWDYQDNQFSTQSWAIISWSGHTSNQPSITFKNGPGMGKVHVSWDGKNEEYSLNAKEFGQVIFYNTLPVSIVSKVIYFFFSLVFLTSFFYYLFCFIISLPVPLPKQHRRGFWIKYSLPVLISSIIVLLIYYPAVMSGDSLVQWVQSHNFQLTDQHPAFHTLMIWLVTKIWDSPAAVAAAQILFLSIVVSWGIGNLVKRGMPVKIGWLISILFAGSPVNWLFVVTLWKDIPYGISLLWLTFIILEIYNTNGKWLANFKNSLLFCVCLLFVSLFRHNGLPVSALIVLILIPFFWKQRKWSFTVLVVFLALRWVITVPVYKVLGVSPMTGNYQYATILYHIGAHVNSGTIFSDQQRKEINDLIPLDYWNYSPCSIDPIMWNDQLNSELISNDPIKYLGLTFQLFLKDPAPDLESISNTGALVFAMNPKCKTYITPLVYKPTANPAASWIDFTVDGVEGENSKLPQLIDPLTKFYDQTYSYDTLSLFNILFWRPAVYLIIIFLVFFAILWMERRWKMLIIVCPALIQSVVLLLVNVAQDLRYQYGVYLISEFFIGLFFFAIWKYSHRQEFDHQQE